MRKKPIDVKVRPSRYKKASCEAIMVEPLSEVVYIFEQFEIVIQGPNLLVQPNESRMPKARLLSQDPHITFK